MAEIEITYSLQTYISTLKEKSTYTFSFSEYENKSNFCIQLSLRILYPLRRESNNNEKRKTFHFTKFETNFSQVITDKKQVKRLFFY